MRDRLRPRGEQSDASWQDEVGPPTDVTKLTRVSRGAPFVPVNRRSGLRITQSSLVLFTSVVRLTGRNTAASPRSTNRPMSK